MHFQHSREKTLRGWVNKSVSSHTLAGSMTNIMADVGVDTSMLPVLAVPRLHGYRRKPRRCLWPKSVDTHNGPISPPHTENYITK